MIFLIEKLLAHAEQSPTYWNHHTLWAVLGVVKKSFLPS
jgi:hypothetical protein